MASRILSSLHRRLHPLASGKGGPPHLHHTPTPTPTPPTPSLHQARLIHASQVHNLKEIVMEEEVEGKVIRVEGRYLPSTHTDRLVRCGGEGEEKAPPCPLCALNLDIKHTDVLILSQFMKGDGGVLPRRVTGLCGRQQRRITWLIIMAQKAGLMPNLAPPNSKRDPRKRYGAKKNNRYFDESTLPKIF